MCAPVPLCPSVPRRVTQRVPDGCRTFGEFVLQLRNAALGEKSPSRQAAHLPVLRPCRLRVKTTSARETWPYSARFPDANAALRKDPDNEQSEPHVRGMPRRTWRNVSNPSRSSSPNNHPTRRKTMEMNSNASTIAIKGSQWNAPFSETEFLSLGLDNI